MMGGVVGMNLFISYASRDLSPQFPTWMRRYLVVHEAKAAVQARDVARCARVWMDLQDLSDEDWDAVEPDLVDEIAVLHGLCAADEDDLQ
jgi:hypothetical protein